MSGSGVFGSVFGSLSSRSSQRKPPTQGPGRTQPGRIPGARTSPNLIIPMIRDSNCLASLQTIDCARLLSENMPPIPGRQPYFEDSHTQETAWAMAPVRPTPFIIYIIDCSRGAAREAYFDCIRTLAPTCSLLLLVFYRETVDPAIAELPSGFFHSNGQYQQAMVAVQYEVDHEKRSGVPVRTLRVPKNAANAQAFRSFARILAAVDLPVCDTNASGISTYRQLGTGSGPSDVPRNTAMGSVGGGPGGVGQRRAGMPHVVIEVEDEGSPQGGSGYGSGSGHGGPGPLAGQGSGYGSAPPGVAAHGSGYGGRGMNPHANPHGSGHGPSALGPAGGSGYGRGPAMPGGRGSMSARGAP